MAANARSDQNKNFSNFLPFFQWFWQQKRGNFMATDFCWAKSGRTDWLLRASHRKNCRADFSTCPCDGNLWGHSGGPYYQWSLFPQREAWKVTNKIEYATRFSSFNGTWPMKIVHNSSISRQLQFLFQFSSLVTSSGHDDDRTNRTDKIDPSQKHGNQAQDQELHFFCAWIVAAERNVPIFWPEHGFSMKAEWEREDEWAQKDRNPVDFDLCLWPQLKATQ